MPVLRRQYDSIQTAPDMIPVMARNTEPSAMVWDRVLRFLQVPNDGDGEHEADQSLVLRA